jgi:hypothetical protein
MVVSPTSNENDKKQTSCNVSVKHWTFGHTIVYLKKANGQMFVIALFI